MFFVSQYAVRISTTARAALIQALRPRSLLVYLQGMRHECLPPRSALAGQQVFCPPEVATGAIQVVTGGGTGGPNEGHGTVAAEGRKKVN